MLTSRARDPKIDHSCSTIFTPVCCKDHKQAAVKRNHIDSSRWRFYEEDDVLQRGRFEPLKRELPSTQRKIRCMEVLESYLENETREALLQEIEKIASESNMDSDLDKEQELEYLDTDSENVEEDEREDTEQLKTLRERKEETNPYLLLLNRLDEEEGIRTPSTEDRLKLAEDQLRISTTKFCKVCEDLVKEEAGISDSERETFLNIEKVQEAFRPKVFDPSLRPPQTVSIAEIEMKRDVYDSKTDEKKEGGSGKSKRRGRIKQGYYLPCDTWFKREKETSNLTPEELEYLNSTSTKAFLKFLEDRKREPPKVLQEIQKKLEKMQCEAKN